MGKNVKQGAAIFLSALLLLSLGGCGQMAATIVPVSALDQVRQNTFSPGSYLVTGEFQVTIVAGIGEGEEQKLMPFLVLVPFEAEYELQGEAGMLRITADMTGMPLPDGFPYYGGNRTGTAYVTADRLFADDPEGRWHYQAYDFAAEFGTLGVTPENVAYWLDRAEGLEVVEENRSFIQYSVLDVAEEGKDIDHLVKVDKESMMILEEELSVGGYIDAFFQDEEDLEPLLDGISKDSYVIVKRSYNFSDFGRAFDIVLPEAARYATEAEASLIGF